MTTISEYEKIVQNLEKDQHSFYYSIKQHHDRVNSNIDTIKKPFLIFIVLWVIIFVTEQIGLHNRDTALILIFGLGYFMIRLYDNLLVDLQGRSELYEAQIKGNIINEIESDPDLFEYYTLDNIHSEKGREMIEKKFRERENMKKQLYESTES